MPGKQKQHDLIPVMDYGQYRRVRKLPAEPCPQTVYQKEKRENETAWDIVVRRQTGGGSY